MGPNQLFQRLVLLEQNDYWIGGQTWHGDLLSPLRIRHATTQPIRLLKTLHPRWSQNFRSDVLDASTVLGDSRFDSQARTEHGSLRRKHLMHRGPVGARNTRRCRLRNWRTLARPKTDVVRRSRLARSHPGHPILRSAFCARKRMGYIRP